MVDYAHTELVAKVEGLIDKILHVEKTHSFETEGRRIFPSEIHLLLRLAAEPGVNATGLAERLGLTKGAVSQTISRLERKGFLRKERDPDAGNALALALTPLGRTTVDHFRGVQARIRREYDVFFASLDAKARGVIERFISHLHRVHGRGR